MQSPPRRALPQPKLHRAALHILSVWCLILSVASTSALAGCSADAHADAPAPTPDSAPPPAPSPPPTASSSAGKPSGDKPADKPAEKTAEADARRALVETIKLEKVSLREVLRLQGETESLRAANLSPLLPGQLLYMPLEEGDEIIAPDSLTPAQVEALRAQGKQVFLTTDVVLRTDVRGQRAQQQQLRAQREQARRDADRTRKLIEKGLGTDANLEQLVTQQQVMKASMDQLQVSIDQAEVKAPISGVVVDKFLEPMEMGSPGVPVVRLIDVSTIVVKVGLPERFIGLAREGMTLPVVIEATGEVYQASLKRIGVQANVKNRTFPLEFHIPNQDRSLRAGMRATVQLDKALLRDVIAIPRDAILPAIGGNEVMIAHDGVAVAKRVTLGAGFRDYIVVTDGLNANDALIVRGHRALVQGEPIEVTSGGVCCSDALASFRLDNAGATP
jgi:membrane fusion protein, multidrug efflux system